MLERPSPNILRISNERLPVASSHRKVVTVYIIIVEMYMIRDLEIIFWFPKTTI